MRKLEALGVLLFILIIAVIMGCYKVATIEPQFKLISCTDFPVTTNGNQQTNLSQLVLDDFKTIQDVRDIAEDANYNQAVHIGDVQVGNYKGTLKGFIIFEDSNEEPTAGNTTMGLEIRQLNNLANEKNNTILYKTNFNATESDFKKVTFLGSKGEDTAIALYIDNISMERFFVPVNNCLAILRLTFTDKSGATFSSEGAILLTDYTTAESDITWTVENATDAIFLLRSDVRNLTSKPFLWRIEGKKPSYLLGTVHVAEPRVLTLPKVVVETIQASDEVLTEVNFHFLKAIAETKELYREKEGKTLADLLPNKLFQRVDSYLLARGKSIIDFSGLKVWVLAQYIGTEGTDEGSVDKRVYDLGLLFGKELGGIETSKEQLEAYDSLSLAEQITLLNDTLNAVEQFPNFTAYVNAFVEAYVLGDESLIYSLSTQTTKGNEALNAKISERLLIDRNRKMVDRIAARMQTNPDRNYLFVFGVAHFPGNDGIIQLLREKGFNVTRVAFEKGDCGKPFIKRAGRCYLPTSGPELFVDMNKNENCETISGAAQKEYCYRVNAVNNNNMGYCFLANTTKNDCILALAVKSRNVSQCRFMDIPFSDFCHFTMSMITSRVSLCERIEYSADLSSACFLYFANKYNNTEYCEKVILDKKVMYPEDYGSYLLQQPYYGDSDFLYPWDILTYYSSSYTYKEICNNHLQTDEDFVAVPTSSDYYLNQLIFARSRSE